MNNKISSQNTSKFLKDTAMLFCVTSWNSGPTGKSTVFRQSIKPVPFTPCFVFFLICHMQPSLLPLLLLLLFCTSSLTFDLIQTSCWPLALIYLSVLRPVVCFLPPTPPKPPPPSKKKKERYCSVLWSTPFITSFMLSAPYRREVFLTHLSPFLSVSLSLSRSVSFHPNNPLSSFCYEACLHALVALSWMYLIPWSLHAGSKSNLLPHLPMAGKTFFVFFGFLTSWQLNCF